MDRSPIYRSDQLRIPTTGLPWRRTLSLATATAALAVSGIVLGYQGVPDLQLDSPARQPNGGGVVDGGHPDALGLLSQVLTARFPRSLPITVPSVAAASPPAPEPAIQVAAAIVTATPEPLTPDVGVLDTLPPPQPVAPVFGPPVMRIAAARSESP